jgi:hypothetical protein
MYGVTAEGGVKLSVASMNDTLESDAVWMFFCRIHLLKQ